MAAYNRAFTYATVPLTDPSGRTIRIIELLPSSDYQITCKLHRISLDDNPYYEALSYCWGNPELSHSIICNGAELKITASLHGALQRLRQTFTSRWLWVDAICINQSPQALEERAAQVSMMRDIYKNAQQVNVWLGEAENQSHHAVYIVKQLAHHSEILKGWGHLDYIPADKLQQVGLDFSSHAGPTEKEWATVQPLFDRPWFRRIWTVQEVAMARYTTVFCGREEISWSDMIRGLEAGTSSRLLYYKRALNPDTLDFFHPAHAAQLHQLHKIPTSSRYIRYNLGSLLSYLLWFRQREATDPRDKVFALLGLVQNYDFVHTIIPDYTLTMEDLYHSVTKQLLEGTRTLDVLSTPRGKPKISQHMPSWVVDWSDSATSTMSLVAQSHFRYEATGTSRACCRFSADNRVLYLHGQVVDTVSRVASILDKSDAFYTKPDNSWSDTFLNFPIVLERLSQNQKVLLEWEAIALERDTKLYHTGEAMDNVFLQTIYAGIPDNYNMKSDCEDWRRNLLPGSLPKKIDATRHPRLFKGAVFLQVFQDVARKTEKRQYTTMAYGRRLGITSKGYLALLPAQTRIGDSIVLCDGGQTPLILRPKGGAFELVGDSYIHGMMRRELYVLSKSKFLSIV
jgi:hypothetical protein